MAALAPCGEVRRPVVARVVVTVGCGEDDARSLHQGQGGADIDLSGAPCAIAPAAGGSVPPTPILQMEHVAAMRAPAALANALRPAEADRG